uniref:THD domain-containing protein n=1 Tax=Ciona savignyi TaxID=51511 RepID=H2ZQ73_CIOSA
MNDKAICLSPIFSSKLDGEVMMTSRPRHNMSSSVLVTLIVLCVVLICHSIYLTTKLERINEGIKANHADISNIQSKCRSLSRQYENTNNETLSHQRAKRYSGAAFVGAHVVGRRGARISRSQAYRQSPSAYFEWDTQNVALSDIRLVLVDDAGHGGTFLKIRTSGYYFIYSQINYYGKGLAPIGHETVRINGNNEEVLMGTQVYQRIGSARYGIGNRASNSDSGYHGGMFYLVEGTKVGVRPMVRNIGSQFFVMQATKSFFGLYFLHS